MREFTIRLNDETAGRLEEMAVSNGIPIEEQMARILSIDLDHHFAELDQQFEESRQAMKEARSRIEAVKEEQEADPKVMQAKSALERWKERQGKT
jgi:phosphomevalonate kinase